MICECYVSFETAKLLKEKGFDAECHSHYYPCHYPDGSIQYHKYERTEYEKDKPYYAIYSFKTLPKDHYLAPTLQMAMKWLREVHKMHVEIRITNHSVSKMFDIPKYYWIIFNPEKVKWMDESTLHDVAGFDTYEKACDSAINYCLRKLV